MSWIKGSIPLMSGSTVVNWGWITSGPFISTKFPATSRCLFLPKFSVQMTELTEFWEVATILNNDFGIKDLFFFRKLTLAFPTVQRRRDWHMKHCKDQWVFLNHLESMMIDQMYGQNRLKYPLEPIKTLILPKFLNTWPEMGKSRPNSNLAQIIWYDSYRMRR